MSDPQPKDPELAEALESFSRTIQANPRREPLEPDKPAAAKVIRLPLWPEPVRGAPNTLLRSALFAAVHSKKRRELGFRISPDAPKQGVTIAAQEGVRISYAGDELNQYDADVFFEALHRARGNPLPTECIFTGYNFLKVIGRSNAKGNYEDLDNSLTRLRRGGVVIDWKAPSGKDWHYEGGLIADFKREKNSKLYKITFTKNILDLFAPACWTQLEWEERMTLKGKPLAQWLHSFYSSHVPAPFPISAAYLHEKTGSPHTLLKNFRVDLKHALTKLEKILGWKATWDGDLITINRPPSASQARHLGRHAKRPNKKPKRRALTHLADLLPSFPKPPENGT